MLDSDDYHGAQMALTEDQERRVNWWNRISENLRAKWLKAIEGNMLNAWEAYKCSAAPIELIVETQAEEARIFREEYAHGRHDGVIIFFNGEVQGWSNKLRDPHRWQAGCVAIDANQRRWQTIGGDYRNGALM